jgi:hypothetical protein
VSRNAPRGAEPLINSPAGDVSPLLLCTLAQIFSELSSEALPKRSCATAFCCGVSSQTIGAEGAARLQTILLQLHLGAGAAHDFAGLSQRVTAEMLLGIMHYRVLLAGTVGYFRDMGVLSKLATEEHGKKMVTAVRTREGDGAALSRTTLEAARLLVPSLHKLCPEVDALLCGNSCARVAYSDDRLVSVLSPSGIEDLRTLATESDFTLLALFSALAPGAELILKVGSDMCAGKMQALYHLRLMITAVESPVGAPYDDTPVRLELAAFGFDSHLRRRLLDGRGALLPRVRRAVEEAMVHFAPRRQTRAEREARMRAVEAARKAAVVASVSRDAEEHDALAIDATSGSRPLSAPWTSPPQVGLTFDELRAALYPCRQVSLKDFERAIQFQGGRAATRVRAEGLPEIPFEDALITPDGLAICALSSEDWQSDDPARANFHGVFTRDGDAALESTADAFIAAFLDARGFDRHGDPVELNCCGRRKVRARPEGEYADATNFALRAGLEGRGREVMASYEAFVRRYVDPFAAAVNHEQTSIFGGHVGSMPASTPLKEALVRLGSRVRVHKKRTLKVARATRDSGTAAFSPQRLLAALAVSYVAICIAALLCIQKAFGLTKKVDMIFDSIAEKAGDLAVSAGNTITAGADRARIGLTTALDYAADFTSADTSTSANVWGLSVDEKIAVAKVQAVGKGSSPSAASRLLFASSDAGSEASQAASMAIRSLRPIIDEALSSTSDLSTNATSASAASPLKALTAKLRLNDEDTARLGIASSSLDLIGGAVADSTAGRITNAQAGDRIIGGIINLLFGFEAWEQRALVKDFAKRAIWIVFGVATSCAILAVAVSLQNVERAYARIALDARHGRWPDGKRWDPERPTEAFNFIGIQLSLALFGYLVMFIALFLATLVGYVLYYVVQFLSMDMIASLWNQFLSVALPVIIVTVVQSLSINFLVNYILLNGRNVAFPRWYSFVDLVLSMLGIISGILTGLMRTLTATTSAASSIIRTDYSVIPPPALRNKDSATKAFDAMLHVDVSHNHPILIVAIFFFTETMLARRRAEAEKYGLIGAIIGPKKTDQDVFVEHALRLKARARNRWHLALMLLKFPWLREHRVTLHTAIADSLAETTLARKALAVVLGPPPIYGIDGPTYPIYLLNSKNDEAVRGALDKINGAAAPKI